MRGSGRDGDGGCDIGMIILFQGCVSMEIGGQQGILVTGGYYNGVSSMFLPLEARGGRSLETYGPERNMPRWEYVGGLTKVCH